MCGKLILTGPQIRLYGAAHKTDPPYVMYVHPQCVDATGEPKINKALENLFKKNNLTLDKTV